jgi:hypothetical protein
MLTTFRFYVVMRISEMRIYSSRNIRGCVVCWPLVCAQQTTVPSMTQGSQLPCQQNNSKHAHEPPIARQQHGVYVPHTACHINGIVRYNVSAYINYCVDLCPF